MIKEICEILHRVPGDCTRNNFYKINRIFWTSKRLWVTQDVLSSMESALCAVRQTKNRIFCSRHKACDQLRVLLLVTNHKRKSIIWMTYINCVLFKCTVSLQQQKNSVVTLLSSVRSGLFWGGGCNSRLSHFAALNANCGLFSCTAWSLSSIYKGGWDGSVRVILDVLDKRILFLPGIGTRCVGHPGPSKPPFRLKMLKISSLCFREDTAEDRLLGHYFLPPCITAVILRRFPAVSPSRTVARYWSAD
jgi:hypothetical protein